MAWVNKYLLTKFIHDGRNLDEGIDCWGLVVSVYRERLGIELPDHLLCDNMKEGVYKRGLTDVRSIALSDGFWVQKGTPKHYDMVMFTKSKYYTHVGIYLDIDGGCVLHAYYNNGCSVQRVANIRGGEWKNLIYYRYENN